MGLARQIFGHSAFLNLVMSIGNLQTFWYGIDYGPNYISEPIHDDGVEVSCKLLQRLSDLSLDKEFEVFLLVQYLEPEIYKVKNEDVQAVVACAEEGGILVLDLYPSLKALAETDKSRLEGFFEVHMTATGNAFVAKMLHEFLVAQQMISTP